MQMYEANNKFIFIAGQLLIAIKLMQLKYTKKLKQSQS